MADRPIIEHEGRRYERRAGTWHDVATHMRVPVADARRLDARARSIPALWDACTDQDWHDDPRNRGKVLISRTKLAELGLDDEWLSMAAPAQPTAPERPAPG